MINIYKMVEAIFSYDRNDTIIKCNINDKMKDIINRFLKQIWKNEKDNNLKFLYGANIINYELTFIQQANELDKNKNRINIIVESNNENNKEVISKDIICPECRENIFINIKDFKINLYGCKKNHKINNILINKYEDIQKIDLSKIICNQCNENNKSNSHNKFYICNSWNKNVCPLCKSKHDNNHIIIKYDDKNYICKKHKDSFIKYYKKCNENICILYENEHNNHEMIDLVKIIPNKNELIKGMEKLKLIIDKFKYKIEIIKEIFNRIIYMMEIYYKINNNIINNYNMNKRNYIKLINLNNIKNNNENLIKEINNIINNDNMSDIFKFSFDKYYNEKGEKYIGETKNGLKDGKGILYYDKDNEYKREKEKCIGMMVIDTNSNLKMIKLKEKENIIIIMILDMKVILKMIKKKEKEKCFGVMVIDMKVNLEMIKEKEKEYIIIIVVIDMKVIIKMVEKKEKEKCIGMMVTNMKVIIKMVKEKEKE